MAYTYANENKAKPISFAISFAIHGIVIGALVMIPSAVVKVIEEAESLETIWIETDPVKPPPPSSDPAPEVETHITRPETVVDLPIKPLNSPVTDVILRPLPPLPLGGLGNIGETGTAKTPIEKLKPVFVGPQINPQYANQFQPDYPPGKLRQEVEGTVRIRVLIGTDGRVKRVERISASDEAFFKVTERQALRSWRFIPATEDGVKIEYWHELTVRFEVT